MDVSGASMSMSAKREMPVLDSPKNLATNVLYISCLLATWDDLMFWRTHDANPLAYLPKKSRRALASTGVSPRLALLMDTNESYAVRRASEVPMATYELRRLGAKVQSVMCI